MLIGPAILAALCIALGVFSLQIFGSLASHFPLPNMLFIGAMLAGFYVFAYVALREVANRRERIAETWGCGIPTQTSKMEYTASGFSEPIVTILKSIFRTQKKSERTYYDDKNVVFKDGKAEIHLMNFFEERIYLPVANFVRKISLKVNNLQRGDVDLHVAYCFRNYSCFSTDNLVVCMNFTLIAYGILNMLFVLLVSPLFISLIKKVKAHAQKRKGPPILQTYRNLAKLLKKETVYSQNSSWIMRVTPLVNIAALLVASLFVPMLVIPQPTDLVGKHNSLHLPVGACKVFHGALRA